MKVTVQTEPAHVSHEDFCYCEECIKNRVEHFVKEQEEKERTGGKEE